MFKWNNVPDISQPDEGDGLPSAQSIAHTSYQQNLVLRGSIEPDVSRAVWVWAVDLEIWTGEHIRVTGTTSAMRPIEDMKREVERYTRVLFERVVRAFEQDSEVDRIRGGLLRLEKRYFASIRQVHELVCALRQLREQKERQEREFFEARHHHTSNRVGLLLVLILALIVALVRVTV
jgi:hypothetical protein